ncbi:MAG: DUF350 domain-containing protein [Myxococcota bacterium]
MLGTMLATVDESGFLIEPDKLLRTGAFFVGAIVLVALAKALRESIAARRGHRLSQLVAKRDNVPVAIEMATFVLAMVIGLLGSLVVHGEAWWEQALDLVGIAAIVCLVLLFNDQVTSRLVLRSIDCNGAVADEHNLAVAIVRAAGNLATAFVLRAALGHDSPLGERLVWVLIGQVALVALSLGYQWLTPYDDIAEVRRKNVAAALPMAGILIAVGIVVEAALSGPGGGWAADLLSLGVDLAVSAVLVLVLRWAGDRLLLRGSTFKHEIVSDQNAGAGFIEGTVYVAGALAVAYFLN